MKLLPDFLGLLGLVVLVASVGRVYLPAAGMLAGLALLLAGVGLARRPTS